MDTNIYTCRICGKEFNFKTVQQFKNHIEKDHNLIWEEYLREYHPELGGYCLECGKETSYVNYNVGFREFCSQNCSSKNMHARRTKEEQNIINEKVKNTCLGKYGSTSNLNTDAHRNRSKEVCLLKYGDENYNNRTKAKETTVDRYGVDYAIKLDEFKNKQKMTCLERYGTEHVLQTDIFKNKVKSTCLERYDDENYNNRTKFSQTQKSNRYKLLKSQLLKFKNIELLDTKEEYISNETHRYSCSVHGEFESVGTNLGSVFCYACFKESKSNLEKEVVEFLSKYVSTVETSNRTVLSGKELDILIPEKNLAIEFDGLYWHSNIKKEKNYHLEKTERCEEQGIQLLHIFENEWLHKRPIVESILLAKLGIFQKRIYGRKCEVKVVPQETYREFTELNHLQGYVPAKLVLGLFYEDELVEICSFGKSRFKSGEMELLRHCSKLHHQIIGGFSKLIKSWKKLNPEESLYTYCDRRYSNGSSYVKSGWKHIGTSAPNYFYIKGNNLESRIKYQKHKLKDILKIFDESLTEQENMSVNGYTWIYDCGNLKFKI